MKRLLTSILLAAMLAMPFTMSAQDDTDERREQAHEALVQASHSHPYLRFMIQAAAVSGVAYGLWRSTGIVTSYWRSWFAQPVADAHSTAAAKNARPPQPSKPLPKLSVDTVTCDYAIDEQGSIQVMLDRFFEGNGELKNIYDVSSSDNPRGENQRDIIDYVVLMNKSTKHGGEMSEADISRWNEVQPKIVQLVAPADSHLGTAQADQVRRRPIGGKSMVSADDGELAQRLERRKKKAEENKK